MKERKKRECMTWRILRSYLLKAQLLHGTGKIVGCWRVIKRVAEGNIQVLGEERKASVLNIH